MKVDKDKLLLLMSNACMNPYDLCKKANVSCSVYYKMVKGLSNSKPATIGKMAKALNVKVEDLLED